MTFVAGGALKPIGGHILSHASATRMFLRKGQNIQNAKRLRLIAVFHIKKVARKSASLS